MSDRIAEIVRLHNALDCVGADVSYEEIAEHLRWLLTRYEEAREVIDDLATRAERARHILKKRGNWGMLDTSAAHKWLVEGENDD